MDMNASEMRLMGADFVGNMAAGNRVGHRPEGFVEPAVFTPLVAQELSNI